MKPVDSDYREVSAQDVARAFDPARLVQARRLSRMTKTELHRKVGVSAAAIGQYERGEVTPRAETIVGLARALDVPIGFLAHGRRRALMDIGQASFRRLRSTSVAQQHQAVSYVEQVWELSSYLEESVEFPALDLPEWAIPEEEDSNPAPDPITAARAVREHWGLGSDPITFLVYELEQHGILTVLFSLKDERNTDEKARIDAFSTTALPRPIVVLTPDKADDVMRHRFSAAHELGHIVLHHGRQGSDSIMEREADAFAAEFLTPRDVLAGQLPRRFNLTRLQELSQHWGVSVHSLVFRSKELEFISEATARRAYMTLAGLTKSGALHAQPIWDFPGEQPELLKNALELLEGAGISMANISSALQMKPQLVRRLAGMEDRPVKLQLVR